MAGGMSRICYRRAQCSTMPANPPRGGFPATVKTRWIHTRRANASKYKGCSSRVPSSLPLSFLSLSFSFRGVILQADTVHLYNKQFDRHYQFSKA